MAVGKSSTAGRLVLKARGGASSTVPNGRTRSPIADSCTADAGAAAGWRAAAAHFEEVVGQHPPDERARSDAAFEIALGAQLFEGRDDGAAGQAVLPGQITRGRQPHAGTAPTVEHRGAQTGRQPPTGWRAGRARGELQWLGRSAAWHGMVQPRDSIRP